MGDLADRLAALCARYGAPDEAVGQLESVLRVLEGAQIAVSGVRDPHRAVDVHVADSLSALELAVVRDAGAIADLGSGAGFPGLVLAAALPEAHVRLIESVGKKCEFLERAVAAARLGNAEVVRTRAEEWTDGAGASDLVTVRALGPLPTLVEYAAPLLRLGGALVAWKGEPGPGEEHDGAAAASVLGMQTGPAVSVRPYEGAERRSLYVYSKVRPTPAGYPRRAGMARKRPLQA